MDIITNHTKIKRSSERSFAIVFSIFFIILFSISFYYSGKFNLYLLSISFLFIFFGVIYPRIFYFPNLLWFKLGMLLNYIISPIIMFLVFLLAFITTKFFIVLLRKKLIYDSFDKNLLSYWTDYQKNKGSMKDQY